jgi:MFS family permease
MSTAHLTSEAFGAYRRTKRLVYVAALLMDLCFGVFLFVGPLAALRLTEKPGLQAVVGVILLAARILFNTLFGRLSDWLGRKNLLLTASALMLVSFIGLATAPNLTAVYALAFLVGVANALYWPVIEAWVGEEVNGTPLLRDIGSFNVAFSTGLVLAPLTSALLQWSVTGPAGYVSLLRPILLGLALAAVTFTFILLRPALSHHQIAELRRERPPLPQTSRSRRFLYAGWLANFVAWCGVGVVRFLFPALVIGKLGLTERTLGLLQGAFYASWVVGFVTWRTWTGWPYRRWPLLVSQTIGAAGLTCIWIARDAWTLAIGLALFGFGMTGPYAASIFYGLDRYADKGTKSGLHETVLAAGMMLGLGGAAALAQWVSLTLPYLVIGWATLAVCGFQWVYLAEGDARPDDGS